MLPHSRPPYYEAINKSPEPLIKPHTTTGYYAGQYPASML